MNSISKIRVYTNGIAVKGTGAYAYIVLESKDSGEVSTGEGKGHMFAPSLLKAKFAQAGPATDEMRMKMRAVYEGVRHCPDGADVDVYTDSGYISQALYNTPATHRDGDIAERFRQYVIRYGVKPHFAICKHYIDDDLPSNDHDEWIWAVNRLCEKAIENYEAD